MTSDDPRKPQGRPEQGRGTTRRCGRCAPNAAIGRRSSNCCAACSRRSTATSRRLAGAADADDVVQDVLVSIARNVIWLVEPRLFRPWAFRIASRAAFSHLRRVRRRGVEETDDHGPGLTAGAGRASGQRTACRVARRRRALAGQPCRAGAALSGRDATGRRGRGARDPARHREIAARVRAQDLTAIPG